jgi:hypothetical protein
MDRKLAIAENDADPAASACHLSSGARPWHKSTGVGAYR